MNAFPTVLLSLALAPALVSAAEPGLTLTAALARVEENHPILRTREAENRLAAARLAHAGTRPTAEVSLQLENVLGTGDLRVARSLETTLQLSRAIDLEERRSARTAVAAARSEAERSAWEERRRELLREAACRFIRIVAAQAELVAAQEREALARQSRDAVGAQARAAVALPSEVARARLDLVDTTLETEHAEHLLASARHALASLWGADSPDLPSAVAELSVLPAAAPYEDLAARLAATPAQARFAALGRWRTAEERLARRQAARGESRWNAGLRRVESTDDFGLVFGFAYALPNRVAGDAAAAEARAERDRTAAEAEAALHAARTTLFALYQELGHARLEHDTARDELIPAASAWLAAIDDGAAAGRYGTRDRIEAGAALFTARRRQIRAAAEYHATLVEIEHLLGAPAAG